MDTETTSFAEFQNCLQNLEVINILTLAYRPTLRWIKHMLVNVRPEQLVSIIDIGCGGGDMLRKIWKMAQGQNISVQLVGIDMNPWSKQSAEQMTPQNAPMRFEAVNLFSLDPDCRADFIISSLFTHHLTDDELVCFIQWMDHHALRGWYINDLHRHPLPYFFIKYAVRLLFTNRMIQHDAPVSVARAFVADEWRNSLKKAGIPKERTSIEWFFPFRYGVACWKK